MGERTCIKRLILDILKPHKPNALDFGIAIAELSPTLQVRVTVAEVDEKTESVVVVLEDSDIDFDSVARRIRELGATLHSIDEVDVSGKPSACADDTA